MSMRYKGSRLSATANTPTSLTASGAWTLQQQMQANGTSTWPFVRDPQFNYVTMLLHGDGSAGANNGSGGGVTPTVTNFNADASTNNFNVTINGDARSDNFNPYQSGYYSNSFNGSSSYLGVSAATIAATGQFCIEAWVYQASRSTGTDQMIFSQYTGGVSGRFYLRFNVDKLSFTTSAGDNSGATTLNTNVWYHVAVTRDASNVVRLFVNGVLDLSATVTQSLQVTTPQIGAAAASSLWNGYISNLRTVSGSIPTSYQTSSTTVGTVVFTPSTSPLTTTSQGASGTSLLTCQSNRFIDNSASALTVTSTSTSIAPAQPFTLPSSVATYGSGYFDGTGDKLITPASSAFNFGTGDFTIEMWVYPNATIPTYGDAFFLMDSRTNASWSVFLSSGKLYFSNSSGTENNGGTIASFTWSHVAVSRVSGTTKGFINGVQAFSFSDSGNYTSSPSLTIGARYVTTGTTDLNGYLSNVRIINGTGLYTTTFTPPTSPLTAVSGTSLLTTQYNGGGNNSGFKDSSQNNFPITRNGNTTQGTFAPYGSNWSNYFNGSSGITAPSSTALDLYGTSFTIQCWMFMTATSGYRTLICKRPAGGGPSYSLKIPTGSNSLAFGNTANEIAFSGSVTYNTWMHIAIVCDGTNTKLYMNGVYDSTVALAATSNNTDALAIGGHVNNGNEYMTGYISNMQVLKGVQLYTANFTPPTAPTTGVTGTTSLLTCQSNRFVDNSQYAATITASGSPSVQRFSPFANATAYNPATLGGSAYFDGTDDYLSYTQQTYSGNFTMECWVYQIASSSSYAMLFSVGGANTQLMIDYSGTGKITFYYNSTAISSASGVFIRNQWNHIAYVRSGSTITIYYNGTSVASGTLSDAIPISYIGGYSSSAYTLNGYMSDVRITTSALYTTTFTPPTAPLATVSGTSVLLNMTNGAIFDNAMMNDLETVGNAQISTSVVKYGTGSLAFDGTGDWLTCPLGPNLTIGASSDFTFECWFRANNFSTNVGCIYSSSAGTDYLAIRNSANLEWANGTIQLNYTIPSASTTTWYHLAVTRSGSTVRMFLNGSIVATGTDTSLILGSGSIFYIGNYAGNTSAGYSYNGYIDDLRITKGYARYTANFTPPTQALPNG